MTCPTCGGDCYQSVLCSSCGGSGEGKADGTHCRSCGTMGERRYACETCGGTGEVDDEELEPSESTNQ